MPKICDRYASDGQRLYTGEYERKSGTFEYKGKNYLGRPVNISDRTLEGLRTKEISFRCMNDELRDAKKKRAELLKGKKKNRAYFSDVDDLSGVEFEAYCKELLLATGFRPVETTSRHNDDGVDLIAHMNDIKFVIQCKRYKDTVTKRAVQEVFSGKGIYGADVAVVLTNSDFTPDAVSTAEQLNVKLWNGDKLERMVKNITAYSACIR